METEETQKNESIFECTVCDFKCSYDCDWNRHKLTRKHRLSLKGNQMETEETQKNEKHKFYNCYCGKVYNSKSGLWKHKKSCIIQHNHKINIDDNNNNIDKQELTNQITPELVMKVLEQNKELTNVILEQNKTINELYKNSGVNTINSHNNISNNKTFNLQFFLNETCKNALYITDFVNSV